MKSGVKPGVRTPQIHGGVNLPFSEVWWRLKLLWGDKFNHGKWGSPGALTLTFTNFPPRILFG